MTKKRQDCYLLKHQSDKAPKEIKGNSEYVKVARKEGEATSPPRDLWLRPVYNPAKDNK